METLKLLGTAASFAVPMIPGIGSQAYGAMIAGQAMKDAHENGENPVTAGVSAYAQQKLLFEPANEVLTQLFTKGAANAATEGGKRAVLKSVGSNLAGVLGASLLIQGTQIGAAAYVQQTQETARVMSTAFNRRGKFGSGHFETTSAGYTMRQRSLNAIRQNGMNVKSVLGNEARNYFLGL